jgi:hypothetical protein
MKGFEDPNEKMINTWTVLEESGRDCLLDAFRHHFGRYAED